MLRNPYKPGAGSRPAFLAGRDKLIESAINSIYDVVEGGFQLHTIFYGVRGVGKTVLLNKLEEELADDDNIFPIHIECSPTRSFAQDIAAKLNSAWRKMSKAEASKALLKKGRLDYQRLLINLESRSEYFCVRDGRNSKRKGHRGHCYRF